MVERKLCKILRYKKDDVYLIHFCKILLTDDNIFYLTNVRIEVTDNGSTVDKIECDNYTT